jgi:glycerol-3-phosphate acyltransferase PlsY
MFVIILKLILVWVIGYLLGSVNTSIIVGKLYGMDIRKHGSGNAGATNTLRVLGKKATVFVTLGDVLKSVIACLIGLFLVGDVENAEKLGLIVGGLGAIAGHNWPVFFGFKGGRGVLTSLVVVLMMDWRIGLILLGVFIIIVAVTRYVSLGSIVGSALFPLVAAIPVFNHDKLFIIFALCLGFLAVIRHSDNIERILKGTESKLGAKKQADSSRG